MTPLDVTLRRHLSTIIRLAKVKVIVLLDNLWKTEKVTCFNYSSQRQCCDGRKTKMYF